MLEQGTETILAVDDEGILLRLIQAMLARYGYGVITAETAGEALQIFSLCPDVKIDLALIDIVLPGMNGIELASEIRKLRPGLPILFISAHSPNPELRPLALRDLPLLGKPFTSVALVKKIREMMTPKAASAGQSLG
jgi:CheY-like chemotaxis protein